MYLLAPLLIYPLWKWPLIGRKIFSAVFAVSLLIPTIITYALRGLPLLIITAS